MNDHSDRPGGTRVLIMGIGNSLMQDDGVGVLIAERVGERLRDLPSIRCLDGGTLGLSLLPEVENTPCLIVIDAAEIGAEPGTVHVFRNEAMDRQLAGRKTTVHELALADLLGAAALSGQQPPQRVLVAIQPADTTWGLAPTPAVDACVPATCTLVEQMAREMAA